MVMKKSTTKIVNYVAYGEPNPYPLLLLRSDENNILLKDSTIAELQYTLVEQCNLFTKTPQNFAFFYFYSWFSKFLRHTFSYGASFPIFSYSLYLNINFIINYLNFFYFFICTVCKFVPSPQPECLLQNKERGFARAGDNFGNGTCSCFLRFLKQWKSLHSSSHRAGLDSGQSPFTGQFF